MNTFKTYFRIVKAKPISFILPIVIFTVMIVLFTSATQEMTAEEVRLHYSYILRGDKPEGFDELIAYLEEGGNVYEAYTEEALRMTVFDGVAYFAFIVEDGKFHAIPQGEPEYRFAAMQKIQSYVGYHRLFTEQGFSDAQARVEELMERETTIRTPALQEDKNVELLQQYFNFAAYVTIVALFNIMIIVSTVFNKEGFQRRTLISRTPHSVVQRRILAGHFVITLVVYLMVVGGALFLYGPQTIFSAAGSCMILGYAVYTACIALIGFFITRVINDLQVGTMITNVVALGMSFISGSFVPASWLSEPVVKASQVFPMYWFIRGNRLAVEGSADYPYTLLVMLLMCVVVFALVFVADFRKTRSAVA